MAYPGGVEQMDLTAADCFHGVREDAARRDQASSAPANYGGNKLKCEALLAEAAVDPDAPLRSTVVRPPAVVGAGCDARHEKLHRHVAGLPPLPPPAKARPPAARPGERFRVAWAGDVASVLAAVVERGAPATPAEAFNVASGAPEGVTLDEYARALAKALGVPTHPSLPDDPGLRNYEKQGVIDTSLAEAELNFVPTPLEDFVAATAAWHTPLLEGE